MKENDMRMSKSISMPLAFVNRVMEAANEAGKSFSEELLLLARLGLNIRNEAVKGLERGDLPEEEKRILGRERSKQ